jgi:hypothetical protein
VKLGAENRSQKIAAIALGVVLLLVIAYEVMPSSSTNASTTLPSTTTAALTQPSTPAKPGSHHGARSAPGKKERAPQSLDPTLHLTQLASTEQIKYEGSGRNIFVAQAADVVIPTPVTPGTAKGSNDAKIFQPPAVAAPPPIPLKFFGFASHPGEPKKIFLSKGDDVFIAGEGEIVDRRYKVVRISPTSVEIQDVVGSGPPQNIPLTQG